MFSWRLAAGSVFTTFVFFFLSFTLCVQLRYFLNLFHAVGGSIRKMCCPKNWYMYVSSLLSLSHGCNHRGVIFYYAAVHAGRITVLSVVYLSVRPSVRLFVCPFVCPVSVHNLTTAKRKRSETSRTLTQHRSNWHVTNFYFKRFVKNVSRKCHSVLHRRRPIIASREH